MRLEKKLVRAADEKQVANLIVASGLSLGRRGFIHSERLATTNHQGLNRT